jgi:hypothetical protein
LFLGCCYSTLALRDETLALLQAPLTILQVPFESLDDAHTRKCVIIRRSILDLLCRRRLHVSIPSKGELGLHRTPQCVV